MSWDNRPGNSNGNVYDQRGVSPNSQIAKLMRLLNWSVKVGRVFGITIKIHFLFFCFIAYQLIEGGDLLWSVYLLAILFISVLLHEFGHCFGARSVGGQADEVLLWPLGGLAYTRPPDTPRAHFVTVVCGPLVNLFLAAAAYVALMFVNDGPAIVSFNPFSIWLGVPPNLTVELIALTFAVNYMLLLFNLALAFIPFDGGRLVQIAMWNRMGYGKSMYLAARFGVVAAGVVALFALLSGEQMLFFIALYGLFQCIQQQQILRHQAMAGGGPDPMMEAIRRQQTPSRADLKKEKALMKKQQQERTEREEIDRILQKVSEKGLQSLTGKEKKILKQDTERLNDQ